MSIVDQALNYEKYHYTHGTYDLSKVIQQTGGQTVTITTAGGQESLFELPPKVQNWGRSVLVFSATLAASGGGNYNWITTDGLTYFRQIQVYTRTGLYLLDLNDGDRYSNMTMRRVNQIKNVETWDKMGGVFEGLSCCNSLAAVNYRPTDAAGGKTSYLEPQYLTVGTVNAATPSVNIQLPLSRLADTILALDKDLYFNGEILFLRFVWNPSSKIYFFKNANNDPTGGTAAAGNVSITNLTLYLAIEVNPQIENMIKSQCLTDLGLQVLTPWVISGNKQNIGPSQFHGVISRYNRAHGMKLLKLYWAAYNNAETSNTAFDHDNKAGAKFISFVTYINNNRTSQYDYYVTNFDDYRAKKESLKGSCILSSDEYYYNWVWVEDFTDGKSQNYLDAPIENRIDGLDLTNEILYQIQAQNSVAPVQVNHYVFAVTQKLLIVSPAGITLA